MRPPMFSLSAETAHGLVLGALRSGGRLPERPDRGGCVGLRPLMALGFDYVVGGP